MKNPSITEVQLLDLSFGDNPRLLTNYAVPEMVDSILLAGGVNDPIHVEHMPDGNLIIRRGTRRVTAALQILESYAEDAERCFPNGDIAAHIHEGLTELERAELICDHGVQRGLVTPHEIERAAAMLFEAGATEGDVAVQLSGLLEVLYPMNSKNAAEYAELMTQLTEADEAGLVQTAEILNGKVKVFVSDLRRGKVQGLKAVWRCPDTVTEARYYHATNGLRENVDLFEGDAYIPVLTIKEIGSLWKEFEKDLKERDGEGQRTYSKVRPGPHFQRKWIDLCAKKQKAEDEPTVVRPKAMGAKAMQTEAETFVSHGFEALSRHHAGDAVEGLKEADVLLAIAELVSEHDKDAWAEVVSIAGEIRKGLAAKDAEAAEAAAAEGSGAETEGITDEAVVSG